MPAGYLNIYDSFSEITQLETSELVPENLVPPGMERILMNTLSRKK